MKRYALNRFLQSLAVVVFAMAAMFIIGRVLGDPVDAIVTEFASFETREQVREELGYNDPVLVQFGRFVGRVVTLDFGVSPVSQQPVRATVLDAIPSTLLLAAAILGTAFPIGFVMGMVGAFRPTSIIDRVTNVIALAGVSVVEFWLGLTLILVVAVPIAGIPTGGSGGLAALVLPVLTGAFRITGRVAQFSRSALLEEYGKPYVEMARAKGISERRLFIHVSRNAIISVMTLSGEELISLINGMVVIETVFAWPGVGRLVVRALETRDLFVLEATIFALVLMVLLLNLLIDIFYAVANPKVKYG